MVDASANDPEPPTSDRIDLRVPGSDRFLEMLRGVVGRAARAAGFSFAGIEDLALAVDEAAVLLLESEPDQIRLEVEGVTSDTGGLSAVISMTGYSRPWPAEHLEEGMRWQVLSALSDEVTILDDGRSGIGIFHRIR